MSNLLDRFKKVNIGSFTKDNNYDDKLLPSSELERHEGISAIIQSWRNILRTPERTADHDPNYGSKLSQFIFEPNDPITREQIEDEVRNKLMTYDDRGKIGQINIYPHKNRKGYTVDIVVRYKGEETNLTIPIDTTLTG